jgi:TIR domain
LENSIHFGPSSISTDTFARSQGKIPVKFLRGCGLGDWEIEAVKLYAPDLTNEERNRILYKIYDLQASQPIQISPLFISYSHADGEFVDKVGKHLQDNGIRYWRDIHEMKAGRIEKQIDRAIRQNPTVLLVLSENSLNSDWVEHEFRTARDLETNMERDVLCPVALDASWKSSRWPKRVMEQITEYNILDFSEWKDDGKFDGMFRKLIDGLELFYKG